MDGIQVDAWARLDANCPMKVEVVADEAQFELGHRDSSLCLIAEEDGLVKLVTIAEQALEQLRTVQEGDAATDAGSSADTATKNLASIPDHPPVP